MKKFLILLAVAGLAWGGYWLWTNDRQKVEEFVGKENIDKVEQRIADLKTGMASSDAAEAIIPTDTATIWKATGPAVYLYSGNPLGKLGAGTIAGIAENQLTPYYEQMELEGTTLCFSDEQIFLLHIKGTDVRGSLKKNSDSSYTMSLNPTGFTLPKEYTSQRAYIQQTENTLTLTVDVKKLAALVKEVANQADNATFALAVRLLQSYDNVCIGFHFEKVSAPSK